MFIILSPAEISSAKGSELDKKVSFFGKGKIKLAYMLPFSFLFSLVGEPMSVNADPEVLNDKSEFVEGEGPRSSWQEQREAFVFGDILTKRNSSE